MESARLPRSTAAPPPPAINDDNDDKARLPMLITYKEFFNTAAIFDLPPARVARLWLFSIGIVEGMYALISLGIAIALHIPVWPPAHSSSYFGYSFMVLNWFVWGLCAASALWCNRELMHTTTGFAAAQLVVNLIVFVVQLVTALAAIVSLNVSANFFAFVTSAILLVLSFIVCMAAAYISWLLVKFQRPAATHLGSAVRHRRQ